MHKEKVIKVSFYYFLVFQALHLIALVVFLSEPSYWIHLIEPTYGWGKQSLDFIIGWSITDAFLAALSIAFGIQLRLKCIKSKLFYSFLSMVVYSAVLFLAINIMAETFGNMEKWRIMVLSLGFVPVVFLYYELTLSRVKAGGKSSD